MLFISILITLLIVWETTASIINYDAETGEQKTNYGIAKWTLSLLICSVIWGHYMGRKEDQKLIEEYQHGCPELEQINEPVYKLK